MIVYFITRQFITIKIIAFKFVIFLFDILKFINFNAFSFNLFFSLPKSSDRHANVVGAEKALAINEFSLFCSQHFEKSFWSNCTKKLQLLSFRVLLTVKCKSTFILVHVL